MRDEECVEFLQEVLPRLGFRWRAFRKVRRQVCRRIRDRAVGLGLGNYESYHRFLTSHPTEWRHLDGLCRITISRFRRDRRVWTVLGAEVLPELAADARSRGSPVTAWSAGCASGEEPYTLVLQWLESVAGRSPGVDLEVLATDADPHLLDRARRAEYPPGTLAELPDWMVERWFTPVGCPGSKGTGVNLRLARPVRGSLRLARQDIRRQMPRGPFHLVLCRNLAFTYFVPDLQRRIARQLTARLLPGGYLVLGSHEELPEGVAGLEPHPREGCLLRRTDGPRWRQAARNEVPGVPC